jgi:phosphoenolpyruvate phosphomutase
MYNKQGIYLREIFHRPGISCLVGTYSALGAKLAERTGFDGIWSSGAGILTSHALPDGNILSISKNLRSGAGKCKRSF